MQLHCKLVTISVNILTIPMFNSQQHAKNKNDYELKRYDYMVEIFGSCAPWRGKLTQ
jgi:hypothetical protein